MWGSFVVQPLRKGESDLEDEREKRREERGSQEKSRRESDKVCSQWRFPKSSKHDSLLHTIRFTASLTHNSNRFQKSYTGDVTCVCVCTRKRGDVCVWYGEKQKSKRSHRQRGIESVMSRKMEEIIGHRK